MMVAAEREKQVTDRTQEELDETLATLRDTLKNQQEAIGGAAIVKAYGMENREQARFEKHSLDFFHRQVKIVASKAAVNPLMEFFSVLAACSVLLYSRHAGLELSDIVLFLGSMVLMYDPVKKLSRVHLTIQQSSAAAERIFAILFLMFDVETVFRITA